MGQLKTAKLSILLTIYNICQLSQMHFLEKCMHGSLPKCPGHVFPPIQACMESKGLVQNTPDSTRLLLQSASRSPKTNPRAKHPNYQPMEMKNWCWPLCKIRKMTVVPQKFILEQHFQLLTPLNFVCPVFRVSSQMENWCLPLCNIRKMAPAAQKQIPEQNSQFYQCP